MTTDPNPADAHPPENPEVPDTPPAPEAAEPETPEPVDPGPHRATIAKGYRVRLLILALGLLGFMGWSLYDGFIKYPKQQVIWDDFTAFMEQHDDWQSRWPEHAKAQGYPESYHAPNKVKERDDTDIYFQYGMAALCAPFGFWFAWCWLAAGSRFVEGDEHGVRTNKGVDLTWDQVEAIEDDRWKSKGISYLRYKDDQGNVGRVLLDDWKFERDPTVAIHKLAEANVKTD